MRIERGDILADEHLDTLEFLANEDPIGNGALERVLRGNHDTVGVAVEDTNDIFGVLDDP